MFMIMIRYRSLVKAIIIVCPLLLLAAGCAGSKPSRFYMLSPVSGGPEGRAPASECRDLAIGVGPVDFPEYLDRPQIVTRTGEDILKLAEHDRWAEPLERNFTRVLAENLSVLLATDRVYIFPWPRSVQVTHRVSVHVSRFDGTLGTDAVLNARWMLLSGDGTRELAVRRSSFTEPVDAPACQALVNAQARLIETLSREIASAVLSLHR